ncbi:MAG: hypothetical protein ACRDS1_08775 [Pseudonocardiaceae bacterium]
MTWYLQSPGDHDTHRGHLRRGRVLAACGVEFTPLRALRSGPALPGDPSDLTVQVTTEPGWFSGDFETRAVDGLRVVVEEVAEVLGQGLEAH